MKRLLCASSLVLFGAFVLAQSGCRDSQCGSGANANVQGQWTITAQGGQSSCQSSSTGTSVTVRTERAVVLQQTFGNGGPDPLALREPLFVDGGSFDVFGRVEGACVDFTTHEIGPGYDLKLRFEGLVREGKVEGSFFEEDSACPASGNFEVSISATTRREDGGGGGIGQPVFNPDGSVRTIRADAGCEGDDAGDGGGSFDAGAGDAGAAGDGGDADAGLDAGDGGLDFDAGECERPRIRIVEHVYRCSTDSQCPAGVCEYQAGGDGYLCVAECESSQDCRTGEACNNLRCEEPGCGCGAGASGVTALWVLVGAALLMRRRTRGA